MRARLWIVNRKGVAARFDRGQLADGILGCFRGEDEVTDIRNRFALFDAHVDLARASIVTHSFSRGDEVFAKLIFAHEVFDRVADVCVGKYCFTFYATNGEFFFARILAAHADTDDFVIVHIDAFDECTLAYFTAVIFKLGYHFFN